MGVEPPRWKDAGGFQTQGGPPADWEASAKVSRWPLGVPPTGGGNNRGQYGRGGNVHHAEAKYSHKIHCNMDDYGTM